MAKHVWQGNVFEGSPLVPSGGATVTVRNAGTSALATTYSNIDGSGTVLNPITVTTGFVRVYLDAGMYNIIVQSSAGTRVLENVEVGLGGDGDDSFTIITENADFTLVSGHDKKYIRCINTADISVTVPAGFAKKHTTIFKREGAGKVAFIESGTNLNYPQGATPDITEDGTVQLVYDNDSGVEVNLLGALGEYVAYVKQGPVDAIPKVLVDNVQLPLSDYQSLTQNYFGDAADGGCITGVKQELWGLTAAIGNQLSIVFSTPFEEAPNVVATAHGTGGHAELKVRNITALGFDISQNDGSAIQANYQAVGKAEVSP